MSRTDARVAALLRRVGTDTDAAAELLTIAAASLKAGEPVPAEIAAYLARAFERTAKAHRSERSGLLAFDLGLAIAGAPKKRVSRVAIAEAVAAGESETSLKRRVAKAQGISESTALKRIKGIKDASKRTQSMLKANGLKTLIRPR